jgi:hypothetical protein
LCKRTSSLFKMLPSLVDPCGLVFVHGWPLHFLEM